MTIPASTTDRYMMLKTYNIIFWLSLKAISVVVTSQPKKKLRVRESKEAKLVSVWESKIEAASRKKEREVQNCKSVVVFCNILSEK